MARSDKFDCDVDRFMAQCIPEPNSGCWLWTGSDSGDGEYASFWDKEVKKNTRASRWIYSKHVRPLKPGEVVMHSCDTPSCVNPAHLTAGSQAANMKDASRKGRLMANKQTHCIHGHEFTPENTVISGINKPQRKCRICLKQRYEKRIKLRDCVANMESIANERDALRAQLAVANERAEKAEAELSAIPLSLRFDGWKQWFSTHGALQGHLQLLREDIFTIRQHAAPSGTDRGDAAIDAIAVAALARTPAQSLAKVQAAALREAAKLLETKYQEGQAAWCLKVEASRLEAEAANG